MDLQLCYSASEDTFPLPRHIKECYGPFGFPERRDSHRPYISSNLVMGLDGRASFRELKGRAGGREASRSTEDRWLIDFLRAHHDAQLIGANTLREEPSSDARGADYGIDDEQLRVYREKMLSLASRDTPVSARAYKTSKLFGGLLPGVSVLMTLGAEGDQTRFCIVTEMAPRADVVHL